MATAKAKIETVKTTEPEIVDIDLSVTARRKFRINGDNSRLVELDPSDLSVLTRIEDATIRLNECINEVQALATDSDVGTDEEVAELGKKFKAIDTKMRKILDDIFQSNVSEVCAPTGSMFDPINGKFRYEHILNALMTFYADNIKAEYATMAKNVSKKTAKYTNKR